MTVPRTKEFTILAEIPNSKHVRHRLAIVLTEADLLRAQLRVSARVERERERLRRLAEAASPQSVPLEGRRDE
jgi:hypothetical protein